MKNVGIIGAGKIASHLKKRLTALGNVNCFDFKRSAFGLSAEQLQGSESEKLDAVFLAISTRDRGEAARDYILACVQTGIPVITCEKGALAYHAEVLRPHLDKIGYRATVGGGTMLLKYLKDRQLHTRRPIEMHAVLNGTLNFIFDEVGHGRSLGEACEDARSFGYAEPGAKDPLSLIQGELADISMKICVLFNTVIASDDQMLMSPEDFAAPILTRRDLSMLGAEDSSYRLIVSISNLARQEYQFYPKEFSGLSIDDSEGMTWNINASFRKSPLPWFPKGVENTVHIIEGELGVGGKYTLTGPGAGAEPTTTAMLADFAELCP